MLNDGFCGIQSQRAKRAMYGDIPMFFPICRSKPWHPGFRIKTISKATQSWMSMFPNYISGRGKTWNIWKLWVLTFWPIPMYCAVNQQTGCCNLDSESLWKPKTIHTWWLIPLSKWVITPVINGISRVNPLIIGVITHLLSGMSHQVVIVVGNYYNITYTLPSLPILTVL